MKFLLFFIFITFILSLGEWEKRSFAEDSIYIECAVRKAFEIYSETNPNSNFDQFNRLTIYSQLVNGINYKMCFYDTGSQENSIQEFIISGPLLSNPEGEYSLYEKNTLKVKNENQNIDNTILDSIKHTLEEVLQNVVLNDINNVEFVENEDSIFYFVKIEVDGKEKKYLLVADKETNNMQAHILSW